MDIKAISFDLDGPLVYMSISVEQYLSSIYEKLGLHFGLAKIASVFTEVHDWWRERFLSGQPRTREAWLEYDYRLLDGLEQKVICESYLRECNSVGTIIHREEMRNFILK